MTSYTRQGATRHDTARHDTAQHSSQSHTAALHTLRKRAREIPVNSDFIYDVKSPYFNRIHVCRFDAQTSLYMDCAQKIQGPFDLTLGPRC